MKDRLITIVLSAATTLGVVKATPEAPKELEVDRLIVRKELIVSDTGQPWEKGFEAHQLPRGIYARSLGDGVAGLWVRSLLIKGDIDDPFDDRFHAIERDGSLRRAPGHISWNVWIDGAWRQMAIIQGDGLELTEVPLEKWSGGTHPLIGQGMMSIGGGVYGGGGLPYPSEVLQLWGGKIESKEIATPGAPAIVKDDGSGAHEYAIVGIAPQGRRTASSPVTKAKGLATLRWESSIGADAYVVMRDGKEVAGPLRIEGSQKEWTDELGR